MTHYGAILMFVLVLNPHMKLSTIPTEREKEEIRQCLGIIVHVCVISFNGITMGVIFLVARFLSLDTKICSTVAREEYRYC
jgi:hypothetical protein